MVSIALMSLYDRALGNTQQLRVLRGRGMALASRVRVFHSLLEPILGNQHLKQCNAYDITSQPQPKTSLFDPMVVA